MPPMLSCGAGARTEQGKLHVSCLCTAGTTCKTAGQQATSIACIVGWALLFRPRLRYNMQQNFWPARQCRNEKFRKGTTPWPCWPAPSPRGSDVSSVTLSVSSAHTVLSHTQLQDSLRPHPRLSVTFRFPLCQCRLARVRRQRPPHHGQVVGPPDELPAVLRAEDEGLACLVLVVVVVVVVVVVAVVVAVVVVVVVVVCVEKTVSVTRLGRGWEAGLGLGLG
jgi:hypothetical protein